MTNNSYRKVLFIIAIYTFLVTIVHGAWHWYLPGYPATRGIAPALLQTLLLMNAAITLFLLIMGLAALAAARSASLTEQQRRAVTLLLLAFWLGRLVLEFVMPVGLPLLFIDKPQLLAKILIALPVVLLSLALLGNSGRAVRPGR